MIYNRRDKHTGNAYRVFKLYQEGKKQEAELFRKKLAQKNIII